MKKLEVEIYKQGGSYFAENKELHIQETGLTAIEAFGKFYEVFCIQKNAFADILEDE